MRIGLNLTPMIVSQPTGVSLITQLLSEALVQSFPQDEFVLTGLVPRGVIGRLQSWPLTQHKNVISHFLPVPAKFFNPLGRFWQKARQVPIETFIGPLDVFHQFDWFWYPSRAPQTAMVFDCTPALFPKWHTPENTRLYRARMQRVIASAQAIFAISDATKRDVQRLYPQTAGKTYLAYPDCAALFKKVSASQVAQHLTRYSIKPGYLLFVGTLEPRKNLTRVLQAYNHLSLTQTLPPLVIAGSEGWRHSPQFKQLISSPQVIPLGYINQTDLVYLYNGARALIYPSLYEGFGLPVLEALRCQTLVITSDVSSLPEIVGPHGFLCQPQSVASIARAILKALKMTPTQKHQSTQQALKHSQKFSYPRTANLIMHQWRQLVRHNQS